MIQTGLVWCLNKERHFLSWLLEFNPQDPHGEGENQFLLSSDLHLFTMPPVPPHPHKDTKWINKNVTMIENEKTRDNSRKLYIYLPFLRILFRYTGQVSRVLLFLRCRGWTRSLPFPTLARYGIRLTHKNSEAYTYLAGEIPWSHRWSSQGEAHPLRLGCVDPPNVGNLTV